MDNQIAGHKPAYSEPCWQVEPVVFTLRKRLNQLYSLTAGETTKKDKTSPRAFFIYNNILVPIEQYSTLKARRLLPTAPTTTVPQQPEIPNIVFQRLQTAKIGAFAGLRWENASLWIYSTQSKFEQVNYPQRLWVSKIAICVTGTTSNFVSSWIAQHPNQKEDWELFKSAFLKRFVMKDSYVVIMKEFKPSR
ncbi:hypothetical protein DSO57_1013231 [Entomophthora muscae]|uniref:Uncharacterized protein n=1 Tax=Entomophthora muscae TaxID=34485 RepID=A0ACC2TTI2_9FUNG|nr:hypothetical protein DSO57_1013231 [Entomophthora muscae]